MCNPLMIAAAAAMAAGTKMQSDAQNSAISKQQNALNSALETQDKYSQQAERTALENAENYDPTKRKEEFDKARDEAGNSLAQQLVQSREAAPAVSQPAGRLSQAFLSGDSKAAANQLEKSIGMAKLMGKMRGSSDLLTQEGYRNADYASRLNVIGRNAQGSYNAAQPGILAAGKVNGGKMALGSGLSSIGSSYLGGALSSGLGDAFKTGAANWMAGSSAASPAQGLWGSMF